MPMLREKHSHGASSPSSVAPRSPGGTRQEQDLRRSPNSAFSTGTATRATYHKDLGKDLSNQFAFPTYTRHPPRIEESDLIDDPIEKLFALMNGSNWDDLQLELQRLESSGNASDAFRFLSSENDIGETPLHIAAWKAPSKVGVAMLQILVQLLPDGKDILLVSDHDGNTPMHLACANLDAKADFMLMKNLLLLAPEALETQNCNGDTPLHLLVASDGFHQGSDFSIEAAAEEAITSLLSMVKHVASMPNDLGMTLLHIAIGSGAHERVLVKLLSIYPAASRMKDHRGMLPLHYVAALGGTPWTFVGQILWAFPDAVIAKTMDGDTPLHLLMSNAHKHLKEGSNFLERNSTKLAELLIGSSNEETSPLLMHNNEDLAPLHCCALFKGPPQLTRVIMESPLAHASATLTTQFGATALHLLCASDSVHESIENVRLLATPEACAMSDDNDRTPLVVAVQNRKVSSEVIKVLCDKYPKAARIKTRSGFLPLHLCSQCPKVKKGVIKVLIKAYPEGVKEVTSRNGNTPLHEACAHGATASVVKKLLKAFPEALEQINSRGEIPLDLAMAHDAPNDVLKLLGGSPVARHRLNSIESADLTVSSPVLI